MVLPLIVIRLDQKAPKFGTVGNNRVLVDPDAVHIDGAMSGISGVEAARRIADDYPGVKVLALSLHADKQFVAAMLEAGAWGYVLKDGEAQDMVRAIRLVFSGEVYLDPGLGGSGRSQVET